MMSILPYWRTITTSTLLKHIVLTWTRDFVVRQAQSEIDELGCLKRRILGRWISKNYIHGFDVYVDQWLPARSVRRSRKLRRISGLLVSNVLFFLTGSKNEQSLSKAAKDEPNEDFGNVLPTTQC